MYHGHSAALQARFGRPGPFWGRCYLFHHKGRPLTLIHEVFSPALEAYLGPMHGPAAAAAAAAAADGGAGGGSGTADADAASGGGRRKEIA